MGGDEPWIQYLFNGLINNLTILKERFELLQRVVVRVCKTLEVKLNDANDYLKTLLKPQDMQDL